MMYKRKFGKKGLVAALVPESALHDRELMVRFEGACIQCGITQDYDIDVYKASETQPIAAVSAQEQFKLMAEDIVLQEYRAVITVGPLAYDALSVAAMQANRKIMHLGLEQESYEENPTFRMKNLDPIFEKNISAEDRMYVIDKLDPAQIAKRMAEQRTKARDEATMTNGFVGVVGPDGRPNIIRVNNADPFGELDGDDEIFEA